MIKVIIVDFDGVIANSINPYLFIKFSKLCNKSWKEIKRASIRFWIKAATRKCSEEEWWMSLENVCGIQKSKLKSIGYSFYKINKNVLEIIKTLKKNYTIILLSNHIPHWFNYLVKQDNIKKYFDNIFTSYAEKIYKSDKRIYRKVIQKLKVKPNECLFVDNKAENIRLAKGIGIKTILFKNANQLKQSLRRMRLDL